MILKILVCFLILLAWNFFLLLMVRYIFLVVIFFLFSSCLRWICLRLRMIFIIFLIILWIVVNLCLMFVIWIVEIVKFFREDNSICCRELFMVWLKFGLRGLNLKSFLKLLVFCIIILFGFWKFRIFIYLIFVF